MTSIKEIFSDIANAIRLKRDIPDLMKPEDMAMQIGLIEGGGGGDSALVFESEFIVEDTETRQTINIPTNGATSNINDWMLKAVNILLEFKGEKPVSPSVRKAISCNTCVSEHISYPSQFFGASAYIHLFVGTNNVIETIGCAGRNCIYCDLITATTVNVIVPAPTGSYSTTPGLWSVKVFKLN